MLINDFKFAKLMSPKVWEIFTQEVGLKLGVKPVQMLLAEEIIGM